MINFPFETSIRKFLSGDCATQPLVSTTMSSNSKAYTAWDNTDLVNKCYDLAKEGLPLDLDRLSKTLSRSRCATSA